MMILSGFVAVFLLVGSALCADPVPAEFYEIPEAQISVDGAKTYIKAEGVSGNNFTSCTKKANTTGIPKESGYADGDIMCQCESGKKDNKAIKVKTVPLSKETPVWIGLKACQTGNTCDGCSGAEHITSTLGCVIALLFISRKAIL